LITHVDELFGAATLVICAEIDPLLRDLLDRGTLRLARCCARVSNVQQEFGVFLRPDN
jgi:hypothetical protein